MTKVKITVLQVQDPKELFGDDPPVTLSPTFGPCDKHHVGQEFIVEQNYEMPEGFCGWAWADIQKMVLGMARGGFNVFITCCTDGYRPVLFKLEKLPAKD